MAGPGEPHFGTVARMEDPAHSSSNPFAPPRAELSLGRADASAFRLEGQVLVAKRGAVLPDLCLWGGHNEGTERIHQTLVWAPPWTAILVFSPLIYIIVYFIVRKRGELAYALGPAARARQRQAWQYGAGGMLLSAAIMALGLAVPAAGGAVALAPLLFLVALVVFLVRRRVVQVERIDKEYIRLKLPPEAAAAFARHVQARAGGAPLTIAALAANS